MKKLDELKKDIIQSKQINETQINQLRKTIYQDKEIDKNKVELLFDISQILDTKVAPQTWIELMQIVVSDHLLLDEDTPGVVDKSEIEWLKEQLKKVDSLMYKKVVSRVRQQAIRVEGEI